MKNPFTKLRAVLGRRRSMSTPADAVTTAAEEFHVELSVPSEDGGEPVTTRFSLGELVEIDTLVELRQRAAEKAKLADEDTVARPIIETLREHGVREAVERYAVEEGVTTSYFNLGSLPRERRQKTD